MSGAMRETAVFVTRMYGGVRGELRWLFTGGAAYSIRQFFH